ncbi:MAG: ABC transporter ATP-binding protein [Alphaproteobacteria bacterium]
MNDPVVALRGITKRYGRLSAVRDVTLEVAKGDIVALLGPSGCGKTTTLRIIAGFVAPDEGRVLIGGRDMDGVRPYERNVGLVFQDYALFPHMTVAKNIAYGLRQRGFPRSDIAARVDAMLELVRLGGHGERRPDELSGGQQQRVALARALATNPEVVLLDEPLSALDAKLREELRMELKAILKSVGSTTIVVTHDQEEAMSLARHIILMQQGTIVQQGSPSEIYRTPRTAFVAEFIGRSNWFAGELGCLVAQGIRAFTTEEGHALKVPDGDAAEGASLRICVRPERVTLHDHDEAAPHADRHVNHLPGTIADVAYLGAEIRYSVLLASGRVVIVIEKNLDQPLRPLGMPCTIRFGARDSLVISADG